MTIADLAITELDEIRAYDVTTGAYLFTIDELQSASIENGEEKIDIVGKQGRKLASLKRNKTATITGANGLVSCGLIALQTGGDFENKATKVNWAEPLTISTNTATTTWKAVGTVGAEIKNLYIKNSDGTLGTKLEQDSSAGAGKFTYDPSTKTLVFATGAYADGTEIYVDYDRKITANVLENISDNFSSKATLYVDATAEDRCGNLYRIQFYFPKADFDGNFTLDMGDNQAVHNFTAEALAGACGGAATFWTYTVFGAAETDYGAGTDSTE